MKRITAADFKTTKWKNGGGITHEIARDDLDGAMLWRLSLAEVKRSGPFSIFPGLDRILYSVSTTGMRLVLQGEGAENALMTGRGAPTHFSGDAKIDGQLPEGIELVENFNLIYDRARLSVVASQLLSDDLADKHSHWRTMLADVPTAPVVKNGVQIRFILYCLSGSVGPLAPREVGLFSHLAEPLSISRNAEAILLRLEVQ